MFVKIVKFDGVYGKYGFKGRAQDIYEGSEKLPEMLPRSTDDAAIVVLTEHLENLNGIRECYISRPRVYAALHWYVEHNPLYHGVMIYHNAHVDEQATSRNINIKQQQAN